MKISGEELYYLIEVLKDSLEIEVGYDWNFKHKRDSRQKFYDLLMKSIFTKEIVNVQAVDLDKFQNIK